MITLKNYKRLIILIFCLIIAQLLNKYHWENICALKWQNNHFLATILLKIIGKKVVKTLQYGVAHANDIHNRQIFQFSLAICNLTPGVFHNDKY